MPTNPNKLTQFWQELKRRRVVYVIVVYATAAFVIIELVNNVYETLNLPDWTPALTLIILTIGFPLAIIFSWIFDVTPEGIEKTKPTLEVKPGEKAMVPNSWRIATYVSMIVILGLLAYNIFGGRGKVKIDESLEKSIAVLPFKNFSMTPGQDIMCLGLTDEIINHLFKIRSFDKIVSLISVLQYKETDKLTPEIAGELNVNYILEGTYKRIGDRLRVTAQLIEAKSDQHLWQNEYDRHYEERIAIQADIALKIADHLNAYLTEREKKNIERVPTTNPEAYDLFMKTATEMEMATSFTALDDHWLNTALEVIALDPDYADAYAGAGLYYISKANYGGGNEIETILIDALPYFDKALEIDENSWVAHFGMGIISEWIHWDYLKAEREYRKAEELMPNHPMASSQVGEFLIKMNRLDDAKDYLNPEKHLFYSLYREITRLIIAGNNAEAKVYMQQFLELIKEPGHKWIGLSYSRLEEYDLALYYLESAMQQDDPEKMAPMFQSGIALAYYKMGQPEHAKEVIDGVIKMSKETSAMSPCYYTGWYYGGISQKDSAFYWLEKAYENHSVEMPWLKVEPVFRVLKDDPRYWDLYERTGHKAYDEYLEDKAN